MTGDVVILSIYGIPIDFIEIFVKVLVVTGLTSEKSLS